MLQAEVSNVIKWRQKKRNVSLKHETASLNNSPVKDKAHFGHFSFYTLTIVPGGKFVFVPDFMD